MKRNGTKRAVEDRIAAVLGIETCGSGHSNYDTKVNTFWRAEEFLILWFLSQLFRNGFDL